MNRRDLLALIPMSLAANRMSAAEGELERLEDWLTASPSARKRALDQSLNRIRRMDSSIHAWVQVRPQQQTVNGPLAGIPVGVKDIIEVKDLALEYGSPVYKGRRASADAGIVRRFRASGAVVMGKTHTAAFAFRTPAPTRNPRNLEHTPGGSSSGSAAAVAAGMVPMALGTQTLGSVLRPASYCGVTGFKPTYGWTPMAGVLPFAQSLDTLGMFTHTPRGMVLLWEALGFSAGQDEELVIGVPDPPPDVEPEMASAFQAAIALFRRGGLTLQPIRIAPLLDKLAQEARVLEYYEGARFHEPRFKQYGDRLLHLADLVREGLQITDQRYREALTVIAESKQLIAEQYKTTPVILVPAATGPAPKGLASTGDARMNSPWTALGTPAISVPMPVTGGLPLGIQLTAAHQQEGRVLRTAVRIAQLFG